MPFKIKDLLIDIEAAEIATAGKYQANRTYCRYPTPCRYMTPPVPCRLPTCRFPTAITVTCPLLTRTPVTCPYGTREPIGEDWWTPIEEGEIGELTPEDLVALRQRLEQSLEAVKVRHAELEAAVVREPKTHEEIDVLETKLEDALKELRARRTKLRGTGQ